jgi:hypothetical protein
MPHALTSGLDGVEQSSRLNGHLNIRCQSFCPQTPESLLGLSSAPARLFLTFQVRRKKNIVDVFNIVPNPFVWNTGVAPCWLFEIAVCSGSSRVAETL